MRLYASLTVPLLLLCGCWSATDNGLVVYCALDAEFAKPIIEQFETSAAVTVQIKTDVEANKTVGLAQALIAEKSRPRCDVFWNNEILHTCRLEKLGLLATFQPKHAQDFPAAYQSKQGQWYGFAARARVLLVNTDLIPEADRPTSIRDLSNAKWRGKVALANPLFGTTATHAACLWAKLGGPDVKKFFHQLRANDIRVLPGNKQVARAVSDGQVAFGLTDTDDAVVEIAAGRSVAIVYPDQEQGGLGTLFIPNTIAMLKNAPHPTAARQFVDFVLSPEVEAKLANGPSAQIPLHPDVASPSALAMPLDVQKMDIDFSAAADAWEATAAFLRGEFMP